MGSAFEQLKSDARRDDYRSMAALARALHEAGTSAEELLHACYGVWFPDEDELNVLGRTPKLIAVMALGGDFYEEGGALLCYDLDELAEGRSTVVGFQSYVEPDAVKNRYGDSLAAVLHANYAEEARCRELEWKSPSNRGAGYSSSW